ncbi:MAG: hypothetical protein E7617_01140 [Ruminococcaceae bacterium]|nr:hypothetical protein [Oscillospiraceae bacterium]
MTVESFQNRFGLRAVCMPSPDKRVSGAYVGDLLSWVMGRAEAENVWITIMSNANIIAVATLADVSCVLLAEGVSLDADTVALAAEKGVNILSTELPAYEIAGRIYGNV